MSDMDKIKSLVDRIDKRLAKSRRKAHIDKYEKAHLKVMRAARNELVKCLRPKPTKKKEGKRG